MQTGLTRKDGSIGNAIGEFTIHIDPNWRIEGKRSILCGSDETNRSIENALRKLIDSPISGISTIGRLLELEIVLAERVLTTFSAWKGQPNWSINHWASASAAYSQFGSIKFDGGAPNNSFKPSPLRGVGKGR